MPVSFDQRLTVPDNVLFRELEGESVILDLDSESYFGLDEVGTRIWQQVTESATIEEAFAALTREYDVEADELRADLYELLGTLLERGLLEVADA
jgi:hypothetical protein